MVTPGANSVTLNTLQFSARSAWASSLSVIETCDRMGIPTTRNVCGRSQTFFATIEFKKVRSVKPNCFFLKKIIVWWSFTVATVSARTSLAGEWFD